MAIDLAIDREELTAVFSVILPPDQTEMSVPWEFLSSGHSFKFGVLVREASSNQTGTESCFACSSAMRLGVKN